MDSRVANAQAGQKYLGERENTPASLKAGSSAICKKWLLCRRGRAATGQSPIETCLQHQNGWLKSRRSKQSSTPPSCFRANTNHKRCPKYGPQ